MLNNHHLVEEIHFALRTNRALAEKIQQRCSQIFHQRIKSLLDQLLSSADKPDIKLDLEAITLNLGDISFDDFEKQLYERIRTQLPNLLIAAQNSPIANHIDPTSGSSFIKKSVQVDNNTHSAKKDNIVQLSAMQQQRKKINFADVAVNSADNAAHNSQAVDASSLNHASSEFDEAQFLAENAPAAKAQNKADHPLALLCDYLASGIFACPKEWATPAGPDGWLRLLLSLSLPEAVPVAENTALSLRYLPSIAAMPVNQRAALENARYQLAQYCLQTRGSQRLKLTFGRQALQDLQLWLLADIPADERQFLTAITPRPALRESALLVIQRLTQQTGYPTQTLAERDILWPTSLNEWQRWLDILLVSAGGYSRILLYTLQRLENQPRLSVTLISGLSLVQREKLLPLMQRALGFKTIERNPQMAAEIALLREFPALLSIERGVIPLKAIRQQDLRERDTDNPPNVDTEDVANAGEKQAGEYKTPSKQHDKNASGETLGNNSLQALAKSDKKPFNREPQEPLLAESADETSPMEVSAGNIPRTVVENEPLAVCNAGITLLWPLLPRLFSQLGLMQNNTFVSELARNQAVCWLDHLVWQDGAQAEWRTSFSQWLCGWPAERTLKWLPITEAAKQEIEQLLSVLPQIIPTLHRCSPDDIRQMFLQRGGSLTFTRKGWLLTPDEEAIDILLHDFPWPMRELRFPWLNEMLNVDWI